MVGYIITGIIMLLFIIFGIILSLGRGANLIAGYNTLPKEEQEKYDTIALSKFMGKAMFVFAFSLIFFPLGQYFNSETLFGIGLAIMIVTTIYIVVYANTKNRFKKDTEQDEE